MPAPARITRVQHQAQQQIPEPTAISNLNPQVTGDRSGSGQGGRHGRLNQRRDSGESADPDWRRCLGIGAVAEQGRGYGADGQGGHDQHRMAEDRGIEAGLALVQPEAVLAELEILLGQRSPAARISRVLAVSCSPGT